MDKQIETVAEQLYRMIDGHESFRFDTDDEDERNRYRSYAKWVLDREKKLQQENERLREALKELHAMVKGECPSLLDEDSGGNARLDMQIEQAIERKQP